LCDRDKITDFVDEKRDSVLILLNLNQQMIVSFHGLYLFSCAFHL
jgi:hypothetical protein